MSNSKNDERPLIELAEGVDFVYHGGMKRDPKDFDPKYEDILCKAHMEADQLIADEITAQSGGFLAIEHMRLQKKVLKKKYGIIWRHIYELNPEMIVD